MGVWDAVKNVAGKAVRDIKDTRSDSAIQIDRKVEDKLGVFGLKKRNIWAFCSDKGFSGNEKWLFIYINKYRPDIKAFWLSNNEETVDFINSLGYKAFLHSSEEGAEIAAASGVYVSGRCDETIPSGFYDYVYLNLFNEIGCKNAERSITNGSSYESAMKKIITNNSIFLNNQLLLVSSPFEQDKIKADTGLTDDRIIKAGSPKSVYRKYFDRVETFDHDILKLKKRDKNTSVIIYSPDLSCNCDVNFINKALPDMKRLEDTLSKNNQLLILNLNTDTSEISEEFERIKKQYESSPFFLFPDNDKDIFEIFDRADIAVTDTSPVFYDLLNAGVKKFIKYSPDCSTSDSESVIPCVKSCNNFEELLHALSFCEPTKEYDTEIKKLSELFLQYSQKDSMDKIIEGVLNFNIIKEKLPTLYSFDIFDTLISRKGLHPDSIFYFVKERMAESNLGFDRYLLDSYVEIRRGCEANVREFYLKTTGVRNSECREISFASIFERMASLYNLTKEQTDFLMETELQAELDDCIAVPEMIAMAENLIKNGEDVILISDMYHSDVFIKKLLEKHSNLLTQIPLYVSSEYGVQKSTGLLFREVYKNLSFYRYGKWLHYGDNEKADKAKPYFLGITPVKHEAPSFNVYEKALVKELKTYDSYLVAALMARFRYRNSDTTAYFSYAYASLSVVSYTLWVLEDAIRRKVDTLYFIARDGYFPIMIAQQAIDTLGLKIKIKYLYGSRKVWRIPSFIDEIDDSFFLSFGDLATSPTFDDLLDALYIDKAEFERLFPSLVGIASDKIITKAQAAHIAATVRASKEYKSYLLSRAAEDRVIVEKYLSQEIDFNENFAFVDCWGRGYTQNCLTRLLHNIRNEEFDVPFYYVRSIYPSQGHNIRYNCTCRNHSMLFVEALFSTNINYKSIAAYKENADGTIEPHIEYTECKTKLLEEMKLRLCAFTKDYLSLALTHRSTTTRALFDYSMDYFDSHQCNPLIVENLADLGYSVTVGGMREYAPALTKKDVETINDKKVLQIHLTSSLPMSLARSDKEIVKYHAYLSKHKKEEMRAEIRAQRALRNNTVKNFHSKEYNYTFDKITTGQRDAYNKAAKAPVENKVVIINTYEKPESQYASIINLYKNKGYKVEILPLMASYTDEKLQTLATAKYIYMSDVTGWFSRINFRKETRLIQLFSEPLPLGGLTQAIGPDYSPAKIQQTRRINKIVYSLIPCAGEGVKQAIKPQLIRTENTERIHVLGNPLTDVYFSQTLKADIRRRLSSLLPDDGKKLIVYLPETNESKKFFYDFLDIAQLGQLCSEEYNLLVVSNQPCDIISSYAEGSHTFAYNGYGTVTQREAMAVADIITGDCTAVFMEGVLTGKPMFFTGAYKPSSEISPIDEKACAIAPVVSDAYSLADYINGAEKYNYSPAKAFKEKFFNGCDGNSAEKIDRYLNEHLELNPFI